MASTSRVWIYQSDQKLSDSDQKLIAEKSHSFLQDWAAHGQSLKSSYRLMHDKFLVISVDESYNQASGCSIDASVALIKNLEHELNLSFFDRTQVCFLIDDEIIEIPMNAVKGEIEKGNINENTITFNNLVADKKGFEGEWKIPVKNSWLKRYFQ